MPRRAHFVPLRRFASALFLLASAKEYGEVSWLESVLLYLAYALVFLFTRRYGDSRWYYLIPLLFTVLVAVGMTKKPGLDVPDNRLTRFLGKISMLLFINHVYLIYAIQKKFPQWALSRKMLVTVAGACLCMAAGYFGGEFLKKAWRFLKKEQA